MACILYVTFSDIHRVTLTDRVQTFELSTNDASSKRPLACVQTQVTLGRPW